MNHEANVPHPDSPNPMLPASGPPSSSGTEPGVPSSLPPSSRGGPPRRPEKKQTPLFGCLFAVSVLLNVAAALVLIVVCCAGFANLGFNAPLADAVLTEKLYSGNAAAKDKIAIIHLDGVIMEGTLGYVYKQIEQAAKDKQVKAIVLRINSPGGSITASDELHRKLTELTKGNSSKKYDAKPIVVSMGSLAASGGYYVAMPAQVIYAEKTTMTGSIGVYGSFLDVHKAAETYGVTMRVIKAGEIKDSGSPFKEMSDKEKQVWQEMINESYGQFLHVVETGRPKLKGELLVRFKVVPFAPGGDETIAAKPHDRYLADGGVYGAETALKKGLIDEIGTLDDAIQAAHDQASMGGEFKAIQYEKPKSLSETLLGIRSDKPVGLNSPLLDPARLRNGLTPRLWYLAPGCELAGMLAAKRND